VEAWRASAIFLVIGGEGALAARGGLDGAVTLLRREDELLVRGAKGEPAREDGEADRDAEREVEGAEEADGVPRGVDEEDQVVWPFV